MKRYNKKKEKKEVGRMRRGQFITTFGCGAIVDMPRESVIMAGTDYWTNCEECQDRLWEKNLQGLLGVDYFVSPPGSVNDAGSPSTKHGLPSFRFPNWMYCPECKRLAHVRKFSFTGNPRCDKCKVNLVPSRFVVACEDGHLDDFPYEWWVHYGGSCKGKSKKPELFIEMSEKSSGLDSIIIKCKSCGNERTMSGSYGAEALKGLKCSRRRPWLNDYDPAVCEKTMRTLQRGATNLHFCVNISALSIPPWSKRVYMKLQKNWIKLKPFLNDHGFFIRMVTGWGLPQRCGCSAEEIFELAVRMRNNVDTGAKNWRTIIEDEYRAFLTGSSNENDEFKTREVEVPGIVKGYVDRVVLALRLREILALCGFKRIKAEYDVDDNRSFNMLSRDFKNWLPGVELKGEGIFIKLDENRLADWEVREDVVERYKYMNSTDNSAMIKGPGFSPRYILLHTLAHLLIRQLILQCGYASAAIKERIYCTFTGIDNSHKEMEGILLYTATNDSEGSLGGLVREGRTELLDDTFRKVLEVASWCSADPLCIQSRGQGINALNLAACHSCTLLPETSCERRNCYLDRAALIGTLDNREMGFFSPLLERED